MDLERCMSVIAIVERGWIARLQIASDHGMFNDRAMRLSHILIAPSREKYKILGSHAHYFAS